MERLRAAQQHLEQGSKENSILLVSGGGQKLKKFEAVTVLQALQNESQSLPLYCAYNPYLSGQQGEEECERLRSKLRAGVAGVYLQIGE